MLCFNLLEISCPPLWFVFRPVSSRVADPVYFAPDPDFKILDPDPDPA